MPVADISRHLADSRMRYATALMQQGRVFTDSDWNEMVGLEAEDQRRTIVETVCAGGSPNDGFRVGVVGSAVVKTYPGPTGVGSNVDTFDVPLGTGSFYLGGYRFSLDPSVSPETLADQADWLTRTLGSGKVPTVPKVPRNDIVFLRGWEQPVTSIEDQEFRERALGGPDTSVRVRRMRRVEVLAGATARNCHEAEQELKVHLARQAPGDTTGPHGFDPETGTERRSKARLTVNLSAAGPNGDPCKPSQQGGYIGAENQAIRVQLVAADQFVWGIDNAAPLYRVQVDSTDPTRQTIKFLTTPRDRASMPLKGQAIELLPWDALLANNEKAAAESGFLATVQSTYDPETQSIKLGAGVPQNMLAWLANLPAGVENPLDPPSARRYFYLRVWTGGPPQAFRPASVNPAVTPTPLAGTGLELEFADFGLPGDYWIIAARPNTPDLVVPWLLLDAAAPVGPRHFFTVLALIRWTDENGIIATVEDCRERFRSLCRNNGCCTVIVGDGDMSHGDFTSIQAAIDALPEEGGEVCVLRGRYEEQIRIADRHNVVIHGCGPDTQINAPPGVDAAFDVQASNTITIRDLFVRGVEGIGVAVTRGCSLITLRGLDILVRDRAGILAKGNHIVIERSRIRTGGLGVDLQPSVTVGREPLVYVSGTHIRVEGNEIAHAVLGLRRSAPGGVQIGGGSIDVEVRRNSIMRGNGNGVTLGSVTLVSAADWKDWTPKSGDEGEARVNGVIWDFDEDNCIFVPADPERPERPDQPDLVPVSEGDLEDIRIIGNRIVDMGRNGIAAERVYFPKKFSDVIAVRRLVIRSNEIRSCMRTEVSSISLANLGRTAYGGIILAEVEVASILDNVIEDVGTTHRDPICGVFVVQAMGIELRRNRICRNGLMARRDLPAKFGQRGGIVIAAVFPPVRLASSELATPPRRRPDGTPAAIIHENVVIAHEGRALDMQGMGAMVVTDNQLTAHGSDFGVLRRSLQPGLRLNDEVPRLSATHPPKPAPAPPAPPTASPSPPAAPADGEALPYDLDSLDSTAVFIWNHGVSDELYFRFIGSVARSLELVELPGGGNAASLVGGSVQFADNLVVYDATSASDATSHQCATLILSQDLVTMSDNQMVCALGVSSLYANSIVYAISVNVVGNRFKEGQDGCFFSAFTVGVWLNCTALNVGSHCIVHRGLIEPTATVSVIDQGGNPLTTRAELRLNPTLAFIYGEDECERFKPFIPRLLETWERIAGIYNPGGER